MGSGQGLPPSTGGPVRPARCGDVLAENRKPTPRTMNWQTPPGLCPRKKDRMVKLRKYEKWVYRVAVDVPEKIDDLDYMVDYDLDGYCGYVDEILPDAETARGYLLEHLLPAENGAPAFCPRQLSSGLLVRLRLPRAHAQEGSRDIRARPERVRVREPNRPRPSLRPHRGRRKRRGRRNQP